MNCLSVVPAFPLKMDVDILIPGIVNKVALWSANFFVGGLWNVGGRQPIYFDH